MINLDTERQKGSQKTMAQHPQGDVATTELPISTPALIAGTSQGLWILDAQPYLELESHSIHAIVRVVNPTILDSRSN